MTTELEQKRQKARKYADVAIELVKEGLFLEEFVTDKRASVRAAIVEHHPQLRNILLTNDMSAYVWRAYYRLLCKDKHPDIELLTRFLDIKKPSTVAEVGKEQLKNLHMKLDALLEEVPTIARTMTCGQLHKAGYAAWAKGLSAKNIETVRVLFYVAGVEDDSPESSAIMDTLIYRYQLDWWLCRSFASKFRELRSSGYSVDDAINMAQS